MGHHTFAHIARRFGITYLLLVIGFSYFAIYPSWQQGEMVTLIVTMFWMLTLAAIIATFAIAVVFFDGEHSLNLDNR